MARYLRVKQEGSRAYVTTEASFLRDNRDYFKRSEVTRIKRLRRGQEFCGGGGAGVAFCVTRPGVKSSLGGYSKHNRKARRVRRGMKRR